MRYTVTTAAEARELLAAIWVSSPSSLRREIARSSARIDAELRDDPVAKGVYLNEGLHRIDAPPLRVYFTVNESDRIVTITDYLLLIG